MAKSYNLTLQLNLQGPANLKSVTSKIRKELSSASGNLNISVNKKSLSSIDAATAKLKVLTTVLQEARRHQSALSKGMDRLSKGFKSFSTTATKTQSSIVSMNANLAKTDRQAKKTGNSLSSLGSILAKGFRTSLPYAAVSKGLNLITTTTDDAARSFVQYERSLNKVAQVTKSGTYNISLLSKEIRSASVTFGASSSELSDLAVTFAQAGLAADQVRDSIKAVAQASLAPTFTNMKDSAEGAIAAMSQFKIQASQLGQVFDALNVVSGRFAVEFDDIVTAIRKGGGAFAAASAQTDEGTESLNKFIGVFTAIRSTTRESADSIANGVKTITARIQQLGRQEKINDILGLQGDNRIEFTVDGEFIGAYEAIDKIQSKIQELNISSQDVRFSRIAEELGGIRQISRVIPLLTDFDKASQAAGMAASASGQNARDAAKAQQTLAVQLKQTYEAFLDFSAAVANSGLKQLISLGLQATKIAFQLGKAFGPQLGIFATIKTLQQIGKFTGLIQSKAAKGTPKGGFFRKIFGGQSQANSAAKEQAVAVDSNTAAIVKLTESVNSLIGRLSSSGAVPKFASGGVVPGSGNRDTVPAMLTPGEFVIRKKAVETIGAGNLQRMNKYATGGKVENIKKLGKGLGKSDIDKRVAEEQRLQYEDYVSSNIKKIQLTKEDIDKKYQNTNTDFATDLYDNYVKGGNGSYFIKQGFGFEQWLMDSGFIPKGYTKASTQNYPVDFLKSGKPPIEVKFKNESEPDPFILSKHFRYLLDTDKWKNRKFTKETDKNVALGGIEVIELADGVKDAILNINPKESTLKKRQQRKQKRDERLSAAGFNLGGLIKKYGIGGGVLATDTVGAAIMEEAGNLTPTIISGSEIIASTLKDRKLDEAGLADMEKRLQAIFGNRSYNLVRAGIDGALGVDVGGAINNRIIEMINNLGADLDFPGIMQGAGDNFLSTLNAGVKGGIFESVLNTIKNSGVYQVAQSSSEKNDYFDFRDGLGEASKWFPSLKDISFVDAKKSLDAARPSSIARKIGNEALREAGSMSLEQLSKLAEESQAASSIENALLNVITEDFGSGAFSRGTILPLIDEGKESLNPPMAGKLKAAYKKLGLSPQKGNAILRKLFGQATGKKWDGKAVSLANRLNIGGLNLGGFVQRFAEGGEPDPNAPSAKQLGFLKSLVKKFYDDDASIERFLSEVYDKGSASKKIQGLQNAQKWVSLFKKLKSEGHMVDLFGANARPYAYPKIGNDSMPFDDLGNEETIREYLRRGKLAFGSSVGQMKGKYGGTRSYSTSGRSSYYRRALGGFIQKFAEGGEPKKDKEFGRMMLRMDGNEGRSYYSPNDTRTGFVQFKKWKNNLWTVGLSQATKGYGPKLYDVAMEAVTEAGGMLTSDRALVSKDAQNVWQYYFKNRGDVKKTPLDPTEWTGNYALIDPKLHGKKETWPPATDPAWVLQSGYSKQPSLINDKNTVTRADGKSGMSSGAAALSYFSRYANGGSAEDTVPALLTPGEFVINKKAAARIGSANLHKMNKADKIQGFNQGGPVGFVQRFEEGGGVTKKIAEVTKSMKVLSQEKDKAEGAWNTLTSTLKDLDKQLASQVKGSTEYKKLQAQRQQIEKQGIAAETKYIAMRKSLIEAEKTKAALITKAKTEKEERRNKPSGNPKGTFAEWDKGVTKVENVMKYLEISAQEAGMSLQQYTTQINKSAQEGYVEKKESISKSRKDLKSTLVEASAKGFSSDKDKGEFANAARSNLQDILGSSASPEEINTAVSELITGIEKGLSVPDIMNSSAKFKEAMDGASDSARAMAATNEQLAKQFGESVEAIRLTSEQAKEGDWRQAGGAEKLGGFGGLLDKIKDTGLGDTKIGKRLGLDKGAFGFSQTGVGKRLSGLQNRLSAEGRLNSLSKVAGKASPKLGKLVMGLGKLSKALGGFPGIISSAVSALVADLALPAMLKGFGIEDTATGAAIQGGVSGAASGAATGAMIGSFIPVIGTAVGAIVGGIIGGIRGAFKGFRTKQLELTMRSLNTTMDKLDKSIESYEGNKTAENKQKVRDLAKDASQTVDSLGEQADIGGWQAAWYNLYMGSRDEVSDQALTAYVDGLRQLNEQFHKIGMMEAASTTLEDVAASRDKLAAGDINSSTLLRTRMETTGQSKNEIIRNYGIAELQKRTGFEGQTLSNAISRAESNGELQKMGEEALLAEATKFENQLYNAKLQEQANRELESVVNQLRKASAAVSRVGTELAAADAELEKSLGNISGSGEVYGTRNKILEVLKNPRAYSDQEFQAASANVSTLAGGGAAGQAIQEKLQAKRVIDEQLPNVLKNVTNLDDAETAISNMIDNAGLSNELGKELKQELMKAVTDKVGEDGAGALSFGELADDVPALSATIKILEENEQLAANMAEEFGKALERSTRIANQYSKALEQVRKRTIEGDKKQAENNRQIKEAFGQRLTMQDRTGGFMAEFNGLSGQRANTIGDISIRDINARRADLERQRNTLQQRRDETATSNPAGVGALDAQLAKVAEEDKALVGALELVANSNDLLQAELEAYRAKVEVQNRQVDLATRLATSDPGELVQIAKEMQAVNVALGSDERTKAAYFSNVDNRRNAMQGLQYLDQLGFDEQTSGMLKAQTQLSVLENTPGMSKILDQMTGSGQTLREILKERSDPEAIKRKQAEVKAASDLQTQAFTALKTMDQNIAAALEKQLTGLDNPVEKAVRDAQAAIVAAIENQNRDGTSGTGGRSETSGTVGRTTSSEGETAGKANREKIDAKAYSGSSAGRTFAMRSERAVIAKEQFGESARNLAARDDLAQYNQVKEAATRKLLLEKAIQEKQQGGDLESFAGRTGMNIPASFKDLDQFIRGYSRMTEAQTKIIQGSGKEVQNAYNEILQGMRNQGFYEQQRPQASANPPETAPVPAPVPTPATAPIVPSTLPTPNVLGGTDLVDKFGSLADKITTLDSSLTTLATVGNTLTTGFGTITTYLDNYSVPLRLDEESTQKLVSFNTEFGRYVDQLSKIKLPDQITMTGKHTLDVKIDGMKAFEDMSESFHAMIVEQIDTTLKQKLPDIYHNR